MGINCVEVLIIIEEIFKPKMGSNQTEMKLLYYTIIWSHFDYADIV